ncbi:uncharacterized protein BJ212DRAFT_1480150 [Suillus subaureus]|uniref:Uncharacterized protein n=1 Tax=Suillus subaureus TaxID=48587 RepID=A0A9P7ECA0_9AGAM|nr:uncharacterized protein BJ212DRAFT_1480150 [Suillus subaureus]KAG1817585.1 hypothetical protein BJ212DRAFT_1480150 [Suillus subaureus]
MREHTYTLLETLERVEYQVEDLEVDWFHERGELEEVRMRHLEEVDELQRKHDEELERQQECIDALEEEVQFQQAMLDVLNDNVKWLEVDNDRYKNGIKGFISRGVQDGMNHRETLASMRDTIVQLFDSTNL